MQLNDDSQVGADHPVQAKRRRTVSSVNASSIPEVPHFYQQLSGETPAFDLLNFFKSQYFANMESFARGQSATTSLGDTAAQPYLNGTRSGEEHKHKEHAMRLEILQVELDTAKLNRETAEINKQIALKRLSRESM